MQNRTDIYGRLALKACALWLTAYAAAAIASCPLACGSWRPLLRRRKGQATVEYLLMLAAVAGMAVIMGVLFHKRILGGMFSMVGMVIGAGKPATPP